MYEANAGSNDYEKGPNKSWFGPNDYEKGPNNQQKGPNYSQITP
ncbi:hypothetical protein ABEV54_07910 [Peribacillus psychrosaccharolyticus]